jgi:hypothetical protein
MQSPIHQVIEHWQYESWSNVETQYKIRNQIIALGIEGLVDVQFTFEDDRNVVKVTPVFANEKDYMWYNLKYDNSL